MLGLLPWCEPVVKQDTMATGRHGRVQLLTSWWPRSRETGRGHRQCITFKDTPQWSSGPRPTSSFPSHVNNAIRLWLHLWVNLLIRSQLCWFTHISVASPAGDKASNACAFKGNLIEKAQHPLLLYWFLVASLWTIALLLWIKAYWYQCVYIYNHYIFLV